MSNCCKTTVINKSLEGAVTEMLLYFSFSVEWFVISRSLKECSCIWARNLVYRWHMLMYLQIVSVHLHPVHCAGQSVCMKAFITPHLTMTDMSSALVIGFLCSTNFSHHQNSKKFLSVFSIYWQSRQKFMSVFPRKMTAFSKWPNFCLHSGDTTPRQPEEPKEEIVRCCCTE